MSCDVGEVTESLENQNELWRSWSDWKLGEWAELIVIVIAELILHIRSLHLRHSSFSNPSLALPTSQLILQPFRCFTYVTAHSATLPSPLLRHRIFTYVTWRSSHDRPCEGSCLGLQILLSCSLMLGHQRLEEDNLDQKSPGPSRLMCGPAPHSSEKL